MNDKAVKTELEQNNTKPEQIDTEPEQSKPEPEQSNTETEQGDTEQSDDGTEQINNELERIKIEPEKTETELKPINTEKKKGKRGLTSARIEIELRRRELAAEVRGSIYRAIRTLIVFAAAAVLLATVMFPTVQVQRGSMSPTLRDGEQIILLTLGSIRRGDIIAFHLGNQTLLKRVIATAGESVSIKEDGSVYVDGELLDEPYLKKPSFGDCDIQLPFQIPDKQFFVMGDNREASMDSRLVDFGTVHRDGIIGKTIVRIWPLERIGLVK
jgi:signal peptidase I